MPLSHMLGDAAVQKRKDGSVLTAVGVRGLE